MQRCAAKDRLFAMAAEGCKYGGPGKAQQDQDLARWEVVGGGFDERILNGEAEHGADHIHDAQDCIIRNHTWHREFGVMERGAGLNSAALTCHGPSPQA